MKTFYMDRDTRSCIDVAQPGELYPGHTICRVSVLPQHRGQGLARQLMNEVLTDADFEWVPLYLDVQPDASGTGLDFHLLYQFYLRCGFVQSPYGYPSMVRHPHPPEERYGQALPHLVVQRRNERGGNLWVPMPHSWCNDPEVLLPSNPRLQDR